MSHRVSWEGPTEHSFPATGEGVLYKRYGIYRGLEISVEVHKHGFGRYTQTVMVNGGVTRTAQYTPEAGPDSWQDVMRWGAQAAKTYVDRGIEQGWWKEKKEGC